MITCVVALGIGIDGTQHPLGLAEGSTENTSVVTDLLTGLRDRGLDTTRPIFVGIDGGKALRAAVVRGFRASGDRSLPAPHDQKCRRQATRSPACTVGKRMRAAYGAESAILAEAQLEARHRAAADPPRRGRQLV